MSIDLTKAVETAALVIRQTWQTDATTTDITNHDRTDARAVIEAALPHIEKQIRARIAEEIRAHNFTYLFESGRHSAVLKVIEDAARIAEGK